jgi:hypothetical protein
MLKVWWDSSVWIECVVNRIVTLKDKIENTQYFLFKNYVKESVNYVTLN